jgi:RNA polymerase sigma-70 factor (ECF subfamily)
MAHIVLVFCSAGCHHERGTGVRRAWNRDEVHMGVPLDSAVVTELRMLANEQRPLSVRELIARYHNVLLSHLRQRLRIADDAADVAQETYIRMLQYEGSREVRSPSSLLFRVAINIANDLGRSEQARHAADHCGVDGLEIESGLAGPEREVAAAQDLEQLYRVIEQLPPKCKQVFLLSRVQNMTYPEIACHCGISVKMVEKHISRALNECMKKTSL